jgi:hypothetical protein
VWGVTRQEHHGRTLLQQSGAQLISCPANYRVRYQRVSCDGQLPPDDHVVYSVYATADCGSDADKPPLITMHGPGAEVCWSVS